MYVNISACITLDWGLLVPLNFSDCSEWLQSCNNIAVIIIYSILVYE